MESSFDIADPTDWLDTPVAQLSSVEAALRCQVCKDFFDTPMITSCSHTFCSLCIRRCLTSDGLCPACRSPDQELRLRSNWAVQELVDAFQRARPSILQMGRDVKVMGRAENGMGKKRKVRETDGEDTDSEEELRSTAERRNTRARVLRSATPIRGRSRVDDRRHTAQRDDGLAACPICDERMKEEDVFSHLDTHSKPKQGHGTASAPITKSYFDGPDPRPRHPSMLMERLPQINYSLLNDNLLRKKLSALGIPSTGSRALVMRRHTEWVNLVNANCDSKTPKTKRELLRELGTWDKTQGRQLVNGCSDPTASVMNKDFDGAVWAVDHDSDFKKLIAHARSKVSSKRDGTTVGDEVAAGAEVDDGPPESIVIVDETEPPSMRETLRK